MKTLDPNKLNTQIYSEASEWLVAFRTGDIDPAGRRAFAYWLRTSPEHVRAYLELAVIWNEGSGLDPERKFDDETLAGTALAEGNILSLDRPSAAPSRHVPGPGRAGTRLFAIAASVFVAVVGAGVWLWIQRDLYTTDIGEQRSVTLADGSHIELNVRSRIRIHFTATERRIDLLDGQAYFHVAKDRARPFIVTTDGTSVRAVGTQFDVYRKKNGTTVTVLEGTVAVLSSSLPLRNSPETRRPGTAATRNSAESIETAELLLAAGEQAVITAQVTEQPAKPDIAAVTAWTRKSLVFQSAPLIEVAEEFNRYNRRPLVVQSPEIHDFQISGIFSSADPSALLRFLEARPGIVVIERADDILVAREP